MIDTGMYYYYYYPWMWGLSLYISHIHVITSYSTVASWARYG